jgi:hypothetical protein
MQPFGCGARLEDEMAHAVVMQVKLDQDVGPDEGKRMLEEIVVPLAKAQAGFQNGIWLHDGKGTGRGVIVFDTPENAASAQGALEPPPGGPELVSSEIYEVGAQT